MNIWGLDVRGTYYGYFAEFPFFRMGNDHHEEYAVYFLEKGAFEYRIGNGERSVLRAGEMVICPPRTNFSKTVLETVTMHLIRIELGGEISAFSAIRYAENGRITETLKRLKGLVSQEELPTERYKMHLICDVWYSVCAELCPPFREYIPVCRGADDHIYSEMTAFIEEHPETSLAHIASVFGYSRVTVNRIFHDNTGGTVGDYIKKMRLERACRLLTQTDHPYKVIAPLCGFCSEYYFASFFKAMTGITPGEYRTGKSRRRSANCASRILDCDILECTPNDLFEDYYRKSE